MTTRCSQLGFFSREASGQSLNWGTQNRLNRPKDLARSGQLLKYWDIFIDPDGVVARDVTARFINGYVPLDRDEDFHDERIFEGEKSEKKKENVPKTFEHIANKALNQKKNGDGVAELRHWES